MATIRKRGTKWQVQVRRRGSPTASRSFASRADAITWARIAETRIDRAELTLSSRERRAITVDDLIARYLDEVTPRKKSAEIERFRFRVIRRHGLGTLTLDQATPAQFTAYRNDRLKHVSGETVRRELSTLQHMFDIAKREWGLSLTHNPLADVAKPKPNPARVRRLSSEEWERLQLAIQKTRNPVVQPLLACALATGMRRGELLAAHWEHLDRERQILYLPVTKNGHSRYVPLSSDAMKAVDEMQGQDKLRIFPIEPNALRLAWGRLTRRANVTGLHFHDLRHEAVSRFFEKGLTVPEVASISGHRNPGMLARYAHARTDEIQRKLAQANL